MRIVISGGTGFLGRAVTGVLLTEGHQVTWLTRGSSPAPAGVTVRRWTPDGTAREWADTVDASDCVINLAGESIGGGRWTRARRDRIRQSRLQATRSLAEAIVGAARPPRVLINASGQGYYGDRGDEVLTEASSPGDDFLARVCVDWEAEARRAAPACRVVLLRNALVLDGRSGALPPMLLPFRLFGGGPVGTGRQFMSWIHRDDWIGLTLFAIADDRADGPLNAGSPGPVRNAEFAFALGKALRRPSWFRLPALALRAGLGEMAESLLLSSTRMVPARPLELGYRFRYPEIGPALGAIVAEV